MTLYKLQNKNIFTKTLLITLLAFLSNCENNSRCQPGVIMLIFWFFWIRREGRGKCMEMAVSSINKLVKIKRNSLYKPHIAHGMALLHQIYFIRLSTYTHLNEEIYHLKCVQSVKIRNSWKHLSFSWNIFHIICIAQAEK